MKKPPLVLLVVMLASQAAAQPGADPAAPDPSQDPSPYPAPPPQPLPPPQPYQPYAQPQPQGYVGVQLTSDQVELLQKGEISDGQHIGGALASVLFGFGVGQAVQGRYSETGWIFTIGEIASFTALVVGLVQSVDCIGVNDDVSCDNGRGEGLILGGLVGLLAFRVWEVVDAFGGPPKHNRKLRDLKMRLGMPVPMYSHRVVPYINHTRDSGATAGIVFRF